jgi:PAS domain S-box-containing protein
MISALKKLLFWFKGSEVTSSAHEGLLDKSRYITEHITAAVFILNERGDIVFASPYAEVLFGRSLSTLSEKGSLNKVFNLEDYSRHERALSLAKVGESFQYRMRATHASGIEMWIECRTAPITSETSDGPLMVSVMLDVTRAVRSEQLVEEKNKELREFAYMISHDLRSPLVTLQGMCAILKQTETLSLENKEVVSHMDTAINRLNQLIGSVIEYSKVTMLDPATERVDLQKIFHEIKQDISLKTSELGITVTFPDFKGTVQGEHTRVYRVLSNIILNAIKYREPTRSCTIVITTETVGREVKIAITDNGIGIPAAMQEAVFKPFQRAHKGPVEGLGIGLASAKKLVERCGGRISLESKEGVGTTFYLYFVS